jgi:ABC-2 type transport system ATP-binding protein
LTTPSAVKADQLTRHFGDHIAVNAINLNVPTGSVFGLLGHNGAGKTTTIRLLNGLLSPTGGSATVLGHSPVTDGPVIRARSGVLTETPALDSRLTAKENLRYFADIFGLHGRDATDRIVELLELFNLIDRADDRVGSFSRGMRQRLALARAMLHHPDLLFLDEPTSGLDPIATRQVHDLISSLASEGRTVFICTHNLEEAERLCDGIAVLQHGKIIASGSPQELTKEVSHPEVEIEMNRASIEPAIQILSEIAPRQPVRVEHDTLIVTNILRIEIPVIITKLVTAGIPIYRVTPHNATLEDVYFALHESGYDE